MADAGPGIYQPKMFINEPWYSSKPLPATSWLIKNFLPEGTSEYPYLTVIGGDPGSYKTTVLAAMFGSLTTGVSFLGRKAKERETLLVAGEDPWGAKKRGQAVFTHLGVTPEEVKTNFFNSPVNLFNDNTINIAGEDIIGQGMTPKVIAFDTMFACSEGADLTKQIDMVRVLNNARRLCRMVGATNAILSHHNTKDSKSLFGSVGLPATVDVIIGCEDLGGDRIEITNERMKMDRKFPDFIVQLTPVKILVLRDDGEEAEGKTEEERLVEEQWLVVPNTAAAEAPRRPSREAKLDQEMEDLEVALRAEGNSATNTEWRKRMRADFGWSDTKFDDKLKEFKRRRPELVGGHWQGDPYSLESQPSGAVAERVGRLGKLPRTTTPPAPSIKGGGGGWG